MHLTPDPSGGKQLVGYRGHPNARSCEKGCLSRIFFRVWNSFLACPPLTARGYFCGYFCGVDPVEAGDLQVDRIKVAVAAGPGMRCSKSGFSALVSCISRFWVLQGRRAMPCSACVVAVVFRATRDGCPFVAAGCAVGSLTAVRKEAVARSRSTSGTPNYPCATLVGGLPVSVGCWTPPFTRGRCSGELKLQSGNETARSSGVNEALMV